MSVPGFSEMCHMLERNFVVNGKSRSTLNNYTRCLAHLALHYSANPAELNEESIDDYLFYCKSLHKTPSESFFKHTVYGLRAVYKVYGMKALHIQLPQIKRQNSLPEVLSREEARALLKTPKYLKHRLVIGMLYGCGLRNYELCNLQIKDIDFGRNTVFVKKGKGNRDRYVPLSSMLKRGLQTYFQTENPRNWVFNSQMAKDGEASAYTTRGIQWVMKEARSKLGTRKKVTAHMLRHTYATHLLEDGMDIVSVKELLGHARIETTLLYLHVANIGRKPKFSPMDTLYSQ